MGHLGFFFCGGAAAGVALGGNGVVYRICFVPRRVCTPFRAARLRVAAWCYFRSFCRGGYCRQGGGAKRGLVR
jgi:hypothetical protein